MLTVPRADFALGDFAECGYAVNRTSHILAVTHQRARPVEGIVTGMNCHELTLAGWNLTLSQFRKKDGIPRAAFQDLLAGCVVDEGQLRGLRPTGMQQQLFNRGHSNISVQGAPNVLVR